MLHEREIAAPKFDLVDITETITFGGYNGENVSFSLYAKYLLKFTQSGKI